ncbi:uncharacterized protein LOC134232206 [Saccostrea cucullata]|uniref:uncharacterized protein LOC134232206 n=1 Tax=Saccostrea cuccullata TaxID=36930 RepID=UPI002ED55D0E
MAASKPKYPLGSPQEHIEMCKTHDLPIDVICEDCDEFICGICAKTDHRDHEWSTLPTAATKRRRGLRKFLKKIKKENLPGIYEKMEKVSNRITKNKEMCDSEIKRLQNHVDEIMARLTKIRKNNERRLTEDLEEKNKKLNSAKSELNKKMKEIEEMVKFMEDNNRTMSDYGFLDNHKGLSKKLIDQDIDFNNFNYSARYDTGEITVEMMENMIGKTQDLNNISLTETSSFKYGDKIIAVLRALCEDQCYIGDIKTTYIEQVNKNGSVSKFIGTDPLEPLGICRSVDGGLLVTLRDMEPNPTKLELYSRRLVRHITVTGDVTNEHEYQENGHTRLFTMPVRVIQNSNSDICVVNYIGDNIGELVILSPSGRMRSIYQGQNLTDNFNPRDVACDSLCNILVTDLKNKQIHLLSPDGEFLKFLLQRNDVNHPAKLSLYKSTLWVGYFEGVVKVFQYTL